MRFQLLTLGTLRLMVDGRAASGAIAQRRRLAFLALLALAGERGLSREKITAYLWPEQPAHRARHLLSEALYVIRRALGENAILAVQDDLRLNTDVVECDVVQFRDALKQDPRSAADIYCGPFLDGFFLNDAQEFDEWVAIERTRLSDDFGKALENLAQTAQRSGDATQAAEYWGRLAHHDPLNTRVTLSYMKALLGAGNRARALQHAAAFTQRQRDELGLEPEPEVTELVRQLSEQPAAARAQEKAIEPRTPLSAEADRYGLEEIGTEFEIVRSLGVGSVAEVFLARELALKRFVAIKVLLPQFAARENARARFEREAQTAARIDHSNVVTAYRFGRLNRTAIPYVVMPYINGGSLEDRLAATGPWNAAQSKHHLAQIASGLAAAHKLGVVHRDVRPGNIMYYRDSDRAMLTDFGLAAVLDTADAAAARLTLPGEQLGNLAYASFEQLRGEQVTERADIYSFGVVGYEMVTGEVPLQAPSLPEMLHLHVAAHSHLEEKIAECAGPELGALIARCLSQKPERRPFAQEIADALSG